MDPYTSEKHLIDFLHTCNSCEVAQSNGFPLRIPGIGFRNVSYALYPSPVYLWWWWRSKTAHKKLLMDPYTSE